MQLRAGSLRLNFSWTFAANVVNAASQWGIVVTLANLGSARMVGTYAWALAIVMPLTTIGMLQLRPILVTDTSRQHHFAGFLGIRMSMMAACVMGVAGLALIVADTPTAGWVLLIVGMARALDGISDLFRSLFQRVEMMQFSALSMGMRGLGGFLTVLFLVWTTHSLPIALAGLVLTWVAVLLGFELPVARRVARHVQSEWLTLRPRLRGADFREVIPMALPLGGVLFLISLQAMIPRLVLEAWHGKEALGYYAAIVYPFATGNIAVSALGQAAMPRLAAHFAGNRTQYRRLLLRLLGLVGLIGAAVILGSILLGRPLLSLAYGPDYANHYPEFLLMSFGCVLLLLASLFGYTISAARRFRIQLFFATVSCAASAVAAFVFVPEGGIWGAAVSYTTAAAVQCFAALACLLWIMRQTRAKSPESALPAAPDQTTIGDTSHA